MSTRRNRKKAKALGKPRSGGPQITPEPLMGLFHEYIGRGLGANLDALEAERRQMLAKIGQLRDAAVLSYAARIGPVPPGIDISVAYEDMLPFADIVLGLKGERVVVVLETPGGSGEVGRDMVELLHERFEHVTFVVPGMAKSTGTIMCLGGHEILMGPASSLGPIDAQLFQDGKRFSADALLEGIERIKREVTSTKSLNPAYIPILQRISPGEIENAHNALEFARDTVTAWLCRYKFAKWEKNGEPVPEETKKARAREIADNLSKQSRWFTHGRSLRIPDLEELGLKISDFMADPDLSDAVQRYHVLLRMSFDAAPVYKIIESPVATIARRFVVPGAVPADILGLQQQAQHAPSLQIELPCPQCRHPVKVQLDFVKGAPLQPGSQRYPNSGRLACPSCRHGIDLAPIRADLESKLGRPALTPQPTR